MPCVTPSDSCPLCGAPRREAVAHAFATLVLDARQRLVLAEVGYGFLLTTFAVGGLLGTFDLGGAGLGSLLGGTLARVWGLTAPFWIAAAVMTLIAAAWRPMSQASAA